MDSGSKARMIRLWRTGSPREGTGMAEGGWGKGEDEGCQRSLCGPERGVGNHLLQASASTPVKAEREIICG